MKKTKILASFCLCAALFSGCAPLDDNSILGGNNGFDASAIFTVHQNETNDGAHLLTTFCNNFETYLNQTHNYGNVSLALEIATQEIVQQKTPTNFVLNGTTYEIEYANINNVKPQDHLLALQQSYSTDVDYFGLSLQNQTDLSSFAHNLVLQNPSNTLASEDITTYIEDNAPKQVANATFCNKKGIVMNEHIIDFSNKNESGFQNCVAQNYSSIIIDSNKTGNLKNIMFAAYSNFDTTLDVTFTYVNLQNNTKAEESLTLQVVANTFTVKDLKYFSASQDMQVSKIDTSFDNNVFENNNSFAHKNEGGTNNLADYYTLNENNILSLNNSLLNNTFADGYMEITFKNSSNKPFCFGFSAISQ